jgi:AraC-like DNA-binding protein
MAVPTIASGVLRKMLTYCDKIGLDRATLLAELEVAGSMLDDPDGRLPITKLHAAWERVLAQVPSVADAQFIGEPYTPGEYGLVGFVVMTSATVDEALGHFVRYIGLWTDEPVFTHDGPTIRAAYRHRFPDCVGLRMATESAFIEIVHGARLLTRKHTVPRAVRFAHRAPSDTSGHTAFFGCDVQFEAPVHELELQPEDLALPLPLADPQLGAFLREAANRALARREVDTSSMIERARTIIAEELARSVPSIEAVARKLAISARTLRRRLAESGTSFRELLDETRAHLAQSYVRNRRIPLAEVAFLLGFSEPSTFHRAFKRWTQTTPAEWRERSSA